MVCSTTRSWHDHLHHHHKHRPQFNFNLKKLAYPLKCIFQAFSCSCEPSIVFLDSSREQGNRCSNFQKPNVPADSSVRTWTVRRINSCTTVSCPHLGTSGPTCLATVSLAHFFSLSLSRSSFPLSLVLTPWHKEKVKGDWLGVHHLENNSQWTLVSLDATWLDSPSY